MLHYFVNVCSVRLINGTTQNFFFYIIYSHKRCKDTNYTNELVTSDFNCNNYIIYFVILGNYITLCITL